MFLLALLFHGGFVKSLVGILVSKLGRGGLKGRFPALQHFRLAQPSESALRSHLTEKLGSALIE